jgi:hypothetical protein
MIFHGASGGRYAPCAALFDLDLGLIELLRVSSPRLPSKNAGAGGSLAKHHHTEGVDMIDKVLGAVHIKAASTKCLQGFQVCQSSGGVFV